MRNATEVNTAPDRSGWRWILALLLLIATIMGAYALPRMAGDRFAAALQGFDLPALQATLCSDTSVAQVSGALQGAGAQLNMLIGQVLGSPIEIPGRAGFASALIPQADYNPLSSRYSLRFRLGDQIELLGFRLDTGIETPAIEVLIRRIPPWAPCISVAG